MKYTVEEVRARFERFASDHGKWPGAVVRSGDAYKLMNTHIQWVAWQAAYADSIERAQAGVTESVRVAGAMLANCAFNLAQCDRLTERERRSLDESRKAWDAAIAGLPASAEPVAQPAGVPDVLIHKALTIAANIRTADWLDAGGTLSEQDALADYLAAAPSAPEGESHE